MKHHLSNVYSSSRILSGANRAQRIRWRPWGVAAFAEASDLDKPIFLVLSTSWSQRCHLLDKIALSKRSVAREINRRYIPIRVDAERRPDISRRYLLHGWPTVAILAPEGEAIALRNLLPADRMLGFLKEFSALYKTRGRELRARAQRALCDSYALEFSSQSPRARGREPDPGKSRSASALKDAAWITGLLINSYDRRSGSFREKRALPNPAAIELLLKSSRKGRPELLEMAANILDKMAAGLHDPIEGGFYRCALTPTWKSPSPEKLLGANADLISAYLLAYRLMRERNYLDMALRSIDFLEKRLGSAGTDRTSAAGGFFASSTTIRGLRSESAAEKSAETRAVCAPFGIISENTERKNPTGLSGRLVDETIFTDWNCCMADAYFDAYLATRDSRYLERALRLLDFLWEKCFEPELGMAHYIADGRSALFGQLEDQAWAIKAFARAAAITGERGHVARAIEIFDVAAANLFDCGSFFDAPIEFETAAPMRIRLRTTVGNSIMARALALLFSISGDERYLDFAEDILATIGPESSLSLHELAEYALSCFEVSESFARAPRRRAA